MRQKGFIFIPILLVVATLGVLGYFIYNNNIIQKRNTPDKNQKTGTAPNLGFGELPQNAEETNKGVSRPSTAIDISNWKTYEDKLYGIIFKYPNTFAINMEGIVAVYNPAGVDYEADVDPSERIKIGIYGKNMSYDRNDINTIFERSLYSPFKSGAKVKVYNKNNIKIHGNDAIRATIEGLDGKVEQTVFAHKKYIFDIITYDPDIVDMSIYEALLGTISFNEVETREGLAGYTNNPANYGFNYPGYWRGSERGTDMEFYFEDANLMVKIKPVSSNYTFDTLKTEVSPDEWKKTKINNIDFLYFESKSPITNNIDYISYFALYKNNLYNLYLNLSWECPEVPQELINQFYDLLNSFRFL